MSERAVKVTDLKKVFKLPHEKHASLKQAALNLGSRSFEQHKVLDGVSFEIKKSEFFGIAGRNGSGKSTLLKLLAGIYSPTSGKVELKGSLTPFIELGIGFNPELTGRDNVYLNGAIFGLSKRQVGELYNEIVDFAELEKFMDQKLKNYSSGMQVRLAFSIAIRAHSDILLIDEVLAVGDGAFQYKCFNYFNDLKRSDKTVIFVSHDMEAMQQYCDRALLLNEGKIITIGSPQDVASGYSQLNLSSIQRDIGAVNRAESPDLGTGDGKYISVKTLDLEGRPVTTYSAEEKIIVEVVVEAKKDLKSPTLGIVIENSERKSVFATNTPAKKIKLKDIKEGERIKARFKVENIFTDGDYAVSSGFASTDRKIAYARVERAHNFYVHGWEMKNSLTHPPYEIDIIR